MPHTTWMIYGAAGTTGILIAEEAIRRGHQPLLAGRSAESLASLGKRLGFPWMAVEHVLRGQLAGALTPAQAFGADFVLNIEGTRRRSAPPLTPLTLTLQENRR